MSNLGIFIPSTKGENITVRQIFPAWCELRAVTGTKHMIASLDKSLNEKGQFYYSIFLVEQSVSASVIAGVAPLSRFDRGNCLIFER